MGLDQMLLWIYVFGAGLLFGSFLNVCICRLPLGETVVKGRSVCRSCGHVIAWYDNLPVLSYFVLGGRCRSCGATFSIRYPAVELGNGLLWLLVLWRLGPTPRALVDCLMGSALVVAALLDHDTREVPDGVSVFIGLLGLGAIFLVPVPSLWERLAGALIISLPMLALACLFGGFGGADIKLSAACGLVLGWQAMLLAGLLAVVLAAAVGIFRLIKGKAGLRDEMAFVPYLAAGVMTAELFFLPIIRWYLSLY